MAEITPRDEHARSPAAELTPLKRALLAIETLQGKLDAGERARRQPIAIIGLGCRFPGADSPEAFWRLLRDGVDAITEVPTERWDVEALYDPRPGQPGKVSTRWGGFLDHVDLFDPQFFSISPREAARMDPQQRLLLEVSWEALERAGLAPERLGGTRTSVFIGVSSNDYGLLLAQTADLGKIDAYTGTGNAFSIAANRLSYFYDFHGPSVAVDTACSSSLVTTHLAVGSLRRGESDLALAGGVNLMLMPSLTVAFSHAHMMAADGRCKTFDAAADGYVRGEGCGILVLKRLADAQRDGDPILAVILGSAVNQDGRSNGLTAPNALAQQAVIREALADAGVRPEQVSYIEAQGTGTPLGDPIEVRALGAVMAGRPPDQPCVIGSVKTNIGHLEAASGVAGTIKAVLMLQHREIVPHLHFRTINPYIPLAELPLRIATERESWPAGDGRLAGVSAFGFGGANAHIILGEAPMHTPLAAPGPDRDRHVLALSARSEGALRQLAGRYAADLAERPDLGLADLCFSANTGRTHFAQAQRLAAVAAGREELHDRLEGFARGAQPAEVGLHVSAAEASPTRRRNQAKTAFLFTGQGAQYFGMGRRLYETQPAFRATLERCAAILRDEFEQPLLEVLYGGPTGAADPERIHQTAYTQPALFAIEYALAQLWITWGIRPDYLLGHGVGEYVAACIAGVFSLEDGLKLIATRGRLMGALPHDGAMAAIFAEPDRVAEAITPHAAAVAIAAINGPKNVVISGRREAVAQLVEAFEAAGIPAKPLTVSHAFHSPLMEPILDAFEAVAGQIAFQPPAIPIISNLTGAPLAAGQTPDAAYWRRHLRAAVQFNAGVQALAELGCNVFVEAGPNPTLNGMGKRCLPGRQALWIPSLKADASDWQTLLDGAAALYTAGQELDWAGFDRDYARRRCALPTYPFQRDRYWLDIAPRWQISAATETGAPARPGATEEAVTGDAGAAAPAAAQPAPDITRAELLATEPEQRLPLLVGQMRRQIARVLALAPAAILPEHRLNNLGLDSIMAIELKSLVETTLGMDLPIATLLQGPSVAELADQILTLVAAPADDAPALVAAEPEPGAEASTREYPLSVGQRAMWLQHQVAPGSVYNPTYAVRIQAAVDIPRLRRVFQALVDRHPALRTTFGDRDGEPFQRVPASREADFRTEDATGWTDADLLERLGDEAYRPFDLAQGPLLRVLLLSRGAQEHVLLLSTHHIVVDLWSLAVLISEVGMLYGAGDEDAGSVLTPLRLRYTDFVRWQRALLESPAGEKQWRYWRERLAGELPDLNLPTDRPRPPVQTFAGSVESLGLGAELTRQVRAFSEQAGVTPFVTLLAAFQTLMHRYTGQTDIIVGSPTTGRAHAELAPLVGYFVSPVAMRTNFTGDPTFTELLAQVRTTVLGALENADYPFPLLVERLRPARDPSRTPVFQVMFAMQRAHLLYEAGLSQFAMGTAGTRMAVGGLSLEAIAIAQRMSPFDLTLLVADSEAELSAAIEYNAALFDRSTVDRMLGHYRTLLASSVADPGRPVAELPILTETERRQILTEWSHGEDMPLRTECIHHAVEAQVDRTPEAPALYFDPGAGAQAETLTYAALDARANQLAHHLQALGVQPETLVALCCERSIEMIVAILGVLKAGGAYVSLDPAAPAERMAAILRDAGVGLAVVHGTAAAETCPAQARAMNLRLVDLDAEREAIAAQPAARPVSRATGSSLAYVIYTSGSTGAPKGVMLQHRGLVNLVQAQVAGFDVRPDDRVFQFAAYTFDASVSEIFIALTGGAALHLGRPEIILSPENLARALRDQRITNTTLPPTLLRLLPAEQLPDLRTIISAGEACTPDLVAKWLPAPSGASWPQRRFLNAYGPTETTIGPTYQVVTEASQSAAVPIGRPIHNIRAYVLDRRGQPAPIGVPGELHIGGVGLARGYLGQPVLTAEKFMPNPFAEIEDSMPQNPPSSIFSLPSSLRLYRTGDLARWLSDGRIEFLGRADQQVKIRGFRVELGEVEAAVGKCAGVKEAAVIADRQEGDVAHLLAYVVPTEQPGPSEAELRAALRQLLPDYMMPAHFVTLETLPLNSSGKVDRKALPRPANLRPNVTEFMVPQTGLEQELASIWQRVLGVEKVGIHDNFFDLGGHSLLMAQAHSALQQLVGREIPIVDLFRHPTISALAKYLAPGQDTGAAAPAAPSSVHQGLDRGAQQRDALLQQRERMKALAQRRTGGKTS